MPVIGVNALSIGKASTVSQPAGLAFLKPVHETQPGLIAGIPFIGPIVRAVVATGRIVRVGWNRFLASENTIVSLIRMNVPLSVQRFTYQRLALDVAWYTLQYFFEDDVIDFLKVQAKKLAVQYFKVYTYLNSPQNVSLVFVPENQPMLDIGKYDP